MSPEKLALCIGRAVIIHRGRRDEIRVPVLPSNGYRVHIAITRFGDVGVTYSVKRMTDLEATFSQRVIEIWAA